MSTANLRLKRGVNIGSEHHPGGEKLKIKLEVKKKKQNTRRKFDVRKLQKEENKKRVLLKALYHNNIFF